MADCLTELSLEGVATVVDRMRPLDWTEISNISSTTSKYVMAYGFYVALRDRGRGRIGWYNGRPVVVVGMIEEHPGVWALVLFGTKEIKHAIYPALRWLRHDIGQIMKDFRGHRLYADSRFDHHEAHALLERMGGKVESVMRGYGADRSTYYRYVWLVGDGQTFALSREGQEAENENHVRLEEIHAGSATASGAADRNRLQHRHQPDAERHGSGRAKQDFSVICDEYGDVW